MSATQSFSSLHIFPRVLTLLSFVPFVFLVFCVVESFINLNKLRLGIFIWSTLTKRTKLAGYKDALFSHDAHDDGEEDAVCDEVVDALNVPLS